MKFKNTVSMFMFKLFSSIAGVSFLILMCVCDVPVGSEVNMCVLVAVFIISSIFAILSFDAKIIFRHLFAIRCIKDLTLGLVFKKTSKDFKFLVKEALEENSMIGFYNKMLSKY